MAATAGATVTAAAMVMLGENDAGTFQIEIAGCGLGEGACFCRGNHRRDDTAAANAGDVARLLGNALNEFRWKLFERTPAFAFAGVARGKLALVGAAAERACCDAGAHRGRRVMGWRGKFRAGDAFGMSARLFKGKQRPDRYANFRAQIHPFLRGIFFPRRREIPKRRASRWDESIWNI